MVVWLLYASGRFSGWFVKIGESSPETAGDRAVARHAGDTQESPSSNVSAGDRDVPFMDPVSGPDEDKFRDDTEEEADTVPEGRYDGTAIRKDSDKEDVSGIADSGSGMDEGGYGTGSPEYKESELRAEQEMQVLEGKDLSTEDVRELPRIDTWEELNRR